MDVSRPTMRPAQSDMNSSARAIMPGLSDMPKQRQSARDRVMGPWFTSDRPLQKTVATPDPVSLQDAELFLFAASSARELAEQVERYAGHACAWSKAGMAIAARESVCDSRKPDAGSWRAAVVSADSVDLTRSLLQLADAARRSKPLQQANMWLGKPADAPKVAFVFSGKPGRALPNGGIWTQRFVESRWALRASRMADQTENAVCEDDTASKVAKTATAASFAAWQVLERCNLKADTALGMGLGELTALTWAGVVDHDDLMTLAHASCDKASIATALASIAFDGPARPVVSAAKGGNVCEDTDVRSLIRDGIAQADDAAPSVGALDADLVIDLGAGQPMTSTPCQGAKAVAVEPHGESVVGLLTVLAEAFIAGAPVNVAALYEDRRLPEIDLWG